MKEFKLVLACAFLIVFAILWTAFLIIGVVFKALEIGMLIGLVWAIWTVIKHIIHHTHKL